ncbi:MAG: DNA repair protein RecN [Clostridia bacterium]|nr:DNA repair protein RecN [Clostridia bacterium]
MLESLTIHQIALIDDVTIHFHQGMHALTGETGAGKSIVVDAVSLVLGGRADRDLIRTGCEKASVEAEFSVSGNEKVRAFMEQESIEYDGSHVVIYREISTSGRNICRVCGIMIPVARLRDLSEWLLDLHGQNDHRFLSDPDMQLAFLDQTGDENHRLLINRVREDCDAFISNHRAYARLVRKNENREAQMQSLEHDLEELRSAHIAKNEAQQLLEERKEKEAVFRKSEALGAVREHLSGNEDGYEALSEIKTAADLLKSISQKYGDLQEISQRCESLYFELEDIAYQINQLSDKLGINPDELDKIDHRLDLIHRMERKYQTTADEIPELTSRLEEEYSSLVNLEDEVNRMSSEHKKTLARYRSTARELTESRKKLSDLFEKKMMKELGDLGMGNTLFRVDFKPNETGRPLMPTQQGDDRIEFMISPNPGEPLKPLAKIASGGELSRMMLAIKTLESSHSGVESMVFDEIDTGISGRMAQVVAEKMVSISGARQVICVTHLPQIAAASDYHYLVQKTTDGSRTKTSVLELGHQERVAEVGRMISGADGITEESNAYAERLIHAAEDKKRGRTKQ